MPASARRGILPRILARFGQLSVCFCACSGAGFPRSMKIPHLSRAASPEPPPPSGLQAVFKRSLSTRLFRGVEAPGTKTGLWGPQRWEPEWAANPISTWVICRWPVSRREFALVISSPLFLSFSSHFPLIFLPSSTPHRCRPGPTKYMASTNTPNTKPPFFLSNYLPGYLLKHTQ